jgi:hypothetical protein
MKLSSEYHFWKHIIGTRILIDEDIFYEFLENSKIGEEETSRKFELLKDHLNKIINFFTLNGHNRKCVESCQNSSIHP